MVVDKNLFLHDLAVAAILKDEGKYLKEWLDYHLLAGVDHFYLYNHESEDNYEDIIKPYVDAGLVTSIYWPGERAMTPAHNDAVKKFKFFNRYMAFIDLDEFIYPKITWGGGHCRSRRRNFVTCTKRGRLGNSLAGVWLERTRKSRLFARCLRKIHSSGKERFLRHVHGQRRTQAHSGQHSF